MKILQNPIAVIVLALVAVALIARQLAWPMIQRSHWMQSRAVAAAPAAPAPNPTPQPGPEATNVGPVAPVAAMPAEKINAQGAGASAGRSAESPGRDPFQGQLLATSQAKVYPPAWQMLTFNGVWRQSGSTLAVINNRVISAGDSILAYKVESFDHDRVWVVGPNGREEVEFGSAHVAPPSGPASGAPTNSVPPATPYK